VKEKPIVYQFFWWVCLACPIILYFLFVQVYGINIPYVDDHGLKGFIVKFYNSSSLGEKISAVFAQHNEHRIGLTRILLLIIYTLKNEIDYKWLMWLGNGFLLGILGLFVAFFKKNKISYWYLLPIPWILFTLSNQENTFWGMASVQNFGIVFLCMWAFWELENERIAWVLVLMTIAVFTSGNGFVALGIIMGILILKQNWKQVGLVLGLSVILFLAYFLSYQKPPATPTATLADWKDLIKAFMAFVGSYADVTIETEISNRVLKAIALGGLLTTIALFFITQNLPFDLASKQLKISKKWPVFLLSTLALIFLSALMVAWSRLIGYGFPTILTSRYKIYSILLSISVYAWLLSVLQPKHQNKLFLIVLPLSILTFINGFWQSISQIDYHYKNLTTNMFNWTYEDLSGRKNTPTQFNYANPATVFDKLVPTLLHSDFSNEPSIALEKAVLENGNVTIRGTGDFRFPWLDPDNGVYLLAKSDRRAYLFPLRCLKSGIKNVVTQQAIFSPIFEGQIPDFEFQAGVYHLGIIVVDNQHSRIYQTKDSIEIKANTNKKIATNW
jgi:hypothetical protein